MDRTPLCTTRSSPTRIAAVAISALAVAAIAQPGAASARVERARYTLTVRLAAERHQVAEAAGLRRVASTHTTLWTAKSTRPFTLQRRGSKRRPYYRFGTRLRGRARTHTVSGWVIVEATNAPPCRVYPQDFGPFAGSRIALRAATVGRDRVPGSGWRSPSTPQRPT